MKNLFLLIIVSSLLQSCGSMEKNDRISRRHDFFNRFSRNEIRASSDWKMGSDILVLRKNNSFRYFSKVMGIINSGYYSGTYVMKNNVLSFKFSKNYKPGFFTGDTLIMEKKGDFFILRNQKSNGYLVVN